MSSIRLGPQDSYRGSADEDGSDDSESDEALDVDKPLLAAEVCGLVLALLALLLVIAGLGFFTVHPPGEEDLCTVEVLGLQNKTAKDQDWDLKCCHALYKGVFDVLGVIGGVHILCGLAGAVSAYAVAMGVASTINGNATSTWFWSCCAVVLDCIGFVVVWLPSWLFPGMSAVVSAGLAPIHAYYIAIMVGHYGLAYANSSNSNQGLSKAAYVEEILYKGYEAAGRVELCLAIGSFSLLTLWWVYLVDAGRGLASLTCWRPDFDNIEGAQLNRVIGHAAAQCRGPPRDSPARSESD